MTGEVGSVKGPIILWRDYGYEGWKPTSFPDIKSALLSERYESSFVITRIVDFDVKEKTMTSPLRDLAAKIEDLAREHPAYSQAWRVVNGCSDHLQALARIEELNKGQTAPIAGTPIMAAARAEREIEELVRPAESLDELIEQSSFYGTGYIVKRPQGKVVVCRKFRTKGGVEYIINDEPVLDE